MALPPSGRSGADAAIADPPSDVRSGTASGQELAEVRIPHGAQLQHGETQVFELQHAGQKKEAFLLSYEGSCHAYLNECPHWSVELDLGDGHLYDQELDRIYCKNHGAIFFPATGECESGPCRGRSLVALRVRRDGDDIIVTP